MCPSKLVPREPHPNLSVKGMWRGSFAGGNLDELKSRGWAPGKALVTWEGRKKKPERPCLLSLCSPHHVSTQKGTPPLPRLCCQLWNLAALRTLRSKFLFSINELSVAFSSFSLWLGMCVLLWGRAIRRESVRQLSLTWDLTEVGEEFPRSGTTKDTQLYCCHQHRIGCSSESECRVWERGGAQTEEDISVYK